MAEPRSGRVTRLHRRPPGKLRGAEPERAAERGFKYEGLGNDFVLLDRRATGQDIPPRAARALCDRRRGVGADGVLVLLPSEVAQARMVVHNADGSVAEMCGNGLRCVVKHLLDGHPTEDTLAVETGAGVLTSRVHRRDGAVDEVEVELGPARLSARNLPQGPGGGPFRDAPVEGVDVAGHGGEPRQSPSGPARRPAGGSPGAWPAPGAPPWLSRAHQRRGGPSHPGGAGGRGLGAGSGADRRLRHRGRRSGGGRRSSQAG